MPTKKQHSVRTGPQGHHPRQLQQDAFASSLTALLRQARKRQGLTQTELASRTGGMVSKPALANYETGHRSLRIETFWAIARALGENPGELINAAASASGRSSIGEIAPIAVDVAAVQASDDPRLEKVRRWFALRAPQESMGRGSGKRANVIVLDEAAITALAALMSVTPHECRGMLLGVGHTAAIDPVTQATQAALAARAASVAVRL